MIFPRLPVAAAALAALLGFGCSSADTDATATAAPAAAEDFYVHVNHEWLSENPVPPEFSSYGVFHEINERNLEVLHEVLEDAASRRSHPDLDRDLQLVGTFWASGMDEETIEELGIEPLRPELEMIAAIKTRTALIDAIAKLHAAGVGVAFGAGPEASFVNPEQTVLFLIQGGLGLPEPSYYLSDEEEKVEMREAYVAHVTKMFRLLGQDGSGASRDAQRVLALETRMAATSLMPNEMRDMNNLANEISMTAAEEAVPNLLLRRWMEGLGLTPPEVVNLATVRYFEGLNAIMADSSPDSWRAYLRFHLVSTFAPMLPEDFVEEDFDFYHATLRGEEEMKPRWKRVLAATEGAAGEAVGKAFVARAFTPAAKQMAEEMVANLLTAYRENLESLEWMGPDTKAEALKKLEAFGVKIGYPDEWQDFSALQFTEGEYLRNVIAATHFATQDGLEKVGKPIDPKEWGMTPQTVNAYYHPMRNEIVFPAAILQPPFFGETQDVAANYGAMGAIIGHEITHGFDDQGSQFDADGVFRVWWTEEDRAEFTRRADMLVQQANEHEVLPGLTLNGELTLGENIADLGGLKMAYRALQLSQQTAPLEWLDGLSPEQRFFKSWATAWRENSRPESLKIQVATDPHATNEFRCNGPLSNLPEFAAAWYVESGTPMARPEEARVVIW